MILQRIASRQTWPLRHEVLRTGRPLATCQWDGDDLHSTHHYGLFDERQIVAIGSLYARAHDLVPGPDVWQIRGMAVSPTRKRLGLGSRVLLGMLDACRDDLGGRAIWCNARTTAAGFYERHGFEIVSDAFEIPDIGPHVVMRFTAFDQRTEPGTSAG